MSDACSKCGVERRKRERWFWIYPDILPPGMLVPVAVYCAGCAMVETPGLVDERRIRNSMAHR